MAKNRKAVREFKAYAFATSCWLIVLSPLLIIGYACNRDKEANAAKRAERYDGAYWRSIEREKQFKDAGLDEFAKIEKRERRKKLRNR